MASREQRETELRYEYEEFLKTSKGQEWKEQWNSRMDTDNTVDFGDFLYDFYPEMLI